MANKTGKKGKKPLQTTLGKASCQNEKEIDLSHIRKPINTSIFGLKQVLSLFQTATEEVQNYITFECDIMYECRTCKTIFRSLANFILHKRNYCRERFNQLDLLNDRTNVQENECSDRIPDTINLVSAPGTPERRESVSREAKKSLSPIIEKLKEKQQIHQLAQNVLNADLSGEVEDDANKSDAKKNRSNDLLLEEIATNNAAVFQTVLENLPVKTPGKPEYMKSEVMEIHGILDSDEAVLGPDGKICTFETNKVNKNPIIPKNELVCTECNLRFSTKKTLTYHIKYKHNNTRLVYVCPDCKDTFANAWCVYRHLFKIHRRTSAQIKRMREQVYNSCIRKDQEPAKKKDKKLQEKTEKTDEENQWLNNIEGDNDFQMCGGCGKRFERKAALHSHAQMCIKRIAVCNTIKENNAKKKEECKENKNKNFKPEKAGPSAVLKGSSRRKPYLLRTYKPNERAEIQKDGSDEEPIDVCDLNANSEKMEPNCDIGKNADDDELESEQAGYSSYGRKQRLISPKFKDLRDSPSIDKIDTEKMLSIIGITSSCDNLNQKENRVYSSEDDVQAREEGTENRKGDSEALKGSAEKRSHTAIDFDLFCQSIAENLATDIQEESDTSPQNKIRKTVPLILRRRNSSKSEKRNFILEQNRENRVNNEKSDKLNLNKEDVLEYENISQINENDSVELETGPSTSTFRISVKSLEDLIGVSTEDHMKNKESTVSDEGQTRKENLERFNNDNFPPTFDEISDTIRASVSPEKLQKRFPKSLKRKRTASFDYTRTNKSVKPIDTELFSSKEDVSFIGRASPYMNQDKLLCIPCRLTYTTLAKLLWHMSAHFSWFRFQCSRCSFISFNKQDCANHARTNHHVKKASIASVVLPIPNWKTVLMAHDFSILQDENDLSGKHTDEILSGSQEEPIVIDEDADDNITDEVGITDWYNNLFVDANQLDSEPDNYTVLPPKLEKDVKQESIDIVNEVQDSFQIELPQEIYTLDVSEIMKDVNDEERFRLGVHVKEEKIDQDDIESSCYMPEQKANNLPIEVKVEVPSEDETNEKLFSAEVGTEPSRHKRSDCVANIRPTRNRTRSIKTLQNDFFYDLSKVIKLNDSSLSKTTAQKHKKTSNGTSQKSKESLSANAKNETKQLRVYSKKK